MKVKHRVSRELRASIRESTQLAGERLNALVSELEAKIAEIVHVAEMRLLDHPAKAAQQYDEMANALRALIATQERVHPAVRESVGIPTSALVRRLKVAEDMTGVRKYVTKGRPATESFYQRGLARAADRIIRAHCSGISKLNLRRAVATVLENAGYKFPDPKKDSAKFDRILQPFPPDPIDEAAERTAKELGERLRDRPI